MTTRSGILIGFLVLALLCGVVQLVLTAVGATPVIAGKLFLVLEDGGHLSIAWTLSFLRKQEPWNRQYLLTRIPASDRVESRNLAYPERPCR